MADAVAVSRWLYDNMTSLAGEPAVAMRAWNGDVWGPRDAASTIVLKHPGALRALLLPPNDLAAGEAYIHDDIDIEGSILDAVQFAARLQAAPSGRLASLRLLRNLRRLPAANRRSAHSRPKRKGRLHTTRRDRASVTAHYDIGNDFFAQFLDPTMVYSSAAFLDPEERLETAQERKIDLICRKLQLKPGQRLLDIGCGWGALALHAARQYGVKATGVTLSAPQAALATTRAKDAGVADSVDFRVLDYRDIEGRFDAIASVGMFEHVGREQLASYFDEIGKHLEPGGAFLNHGIVTRDLRHQRTRPTFINTHVFPDGELIPVNEVIAKAEGAGFELRDAESLRASYALTLRRWIDNLETNRKLAIDSTDQTTYRIWRLYMSGSAIAFEAGAISVYQLLFHTGDRPWTHGRHHLIAKDDHEPAAVDAHQIWA